MISVVIAVYNGEKTLPRCLTSLFNQTYSDFEIIIIDDGSTDNTAKMCAEYAQKDNRISLYSQKHAGVSHSRNSGLKYANGDYVVFVDSDDYVSDDFLSSLIATSKRENADLVGCKIYSVKNGHYSVERTKIIKNDPVYNLFKNCRGFTCNKLYSMHIIKKHNLSFDESISMCEDLLFLFEYVKHSNKIFFIDKPLYFYIISNNSLSSAMDNKWFNIISVYNSILTQKNNYSPPTKDLLAYELLCILEEAKMRCKIVSKNFDTLCEELHINYPAIRDRYYSNIIKSDALTLKEKMRLVCFTRFNNISRLIKFR